MRLSGEEAGIRVLLTRCYVMYIFVYDHILSLREKTREEKGRHPVKKIGKPYEEEEEGKRNNERQGEREYV